MKIDDIEVTLVRSKIKSLYLRVVRPETQNSCQVKLSAPFFLNEEIIKNFVLDKKDWIKQKQNYLANRPIKNSYQYCCGEKHYFLGKSYTLKIVETKQFKTIQTNKTHLILPIAKSNSQEYKKKILDQWYREELKKQIPKIISKWEKTIGVTVREWRIRKMKTRWGSCHIKAGRIWLNLELVKNSIRCLEYVIVHEMIHLLERKHNSRFYALISHYLPNWKEVNQELNTGLKL